jgi:hypothetical protein
MLSTRGHHISFTKSKRDEQQKYYLEPYHDTFKTKGCTDPSVLLALVHTFLPTHEKLRILYAASSNTEEIT